MPVIVETLAQPSAQDRLDLAKIYADAPDWLFAPHADGAALVAAGLAAGELIAGRFNDRLLGAALLRRGDDAWQNAPPCLPSRGSARPCCNAWSRWAWTASSGCATATPRVSSPRARP